MSGRARLALLLCAAAFLAYGAWCLAFELVALSTASSASAGLLALVALMGAAAALRWASPRAAGLASGAVAALGVAGLGGAAKVDHARVDGVAPNLLLVLVGLAGVGLLLAAIAAANVRARRGVAAALALVGLHAANEAGVLRLGLELHLLLATVPGFLGAALAAWSSIAGAPSTVQTSPPGSPYRDAAGNSAPEAPGSADQSLLVAAKGLRIYAVGYTAFFALLSVGLIGSVLCKLASVPLTGETTSLAIVVVTLGACTLLGAVMSVGLYVHAGAIPANGPVRRAYFASHATLVGLVADVLLLHDLVAGAAPYALRDFFLALGAMGCAMLSLTSSCVRLVSRTPAHARTSWHATWLYAVLVLACGAFAAGFLAPVAFLFGVVLLLVSALVFGVFVHGARRDLVQLASQAALARARLPG